MLVIKTDAEYFKKATGITTFTCEDGLLIKQAIEEAVSTNEAKTIIATSVGRNKADEIVAQFKITWSYKAKAQ